jgi:hypothetical protein
MIINYFREVSRNFVLAVKQRTTSPVNNSGAVFIAKCCRPGPCMARTQIVADIVLDENIIRCLQVSPVSNRFIKMAHECPVVLDQHAAPPHNLDRSSPIILRSFHILVEELDGALHGQAEALREVVIIAGVGVHLDGLTGRLHGLI